MPIIKTLTAPNGAVATFHKPGTAEISYRDSVAVVRVLSWVDQAAHDASGGQVGQVWTWPITLAITDVADTEAALVSAGVFSGGTIVADEGGGLEARRKRQWALIKQQREALEYGGFTWDGSTFDSDPESQCRVQGAVQMAVMAASQGQPFEINWVLADNSTRSLSKTDMVEVGMALGAHVGALFAQGVALRAAVTASSEPETISWPTA